MSKFEFIPPDINFVSMVNEAMKQNAAVLEMNKFLLENVQYRTMVIEAEKEEAKK